MAPPNTAMRNTHGGTTSKINKILQKIRPYVQMHGGDVVLLDFKKNAVRLKIFGSCKDCRLADLTYNNLIGELLKKEVPEVKHVVIEK